MTPKRRILIALTAVVAAVVTCTTVPVLPMGWDIVGDNLRLESYSAAFRRVDHPTGSVRVDAQRRIGLLTGNGNHCDFFVGEVRRFDGDREDLRSFYGSQTVRGVGSLRLAFVDDGGFAADGETVLPPAWARYETGRYRLQAT